MSFRFVAAVVLMIASWPAIAGEWIDLERRLTPEQLRATGLDTLTPAQLAALNAVLRDDDADRARAQRDALAAAQAEAAAARAAEQAAIAQEARPAAARDLTQQPGYAEGPSTGTVVGTVAGWKPGDEFRFADGQVWKVLKGEMKLPRALESPVVRLVPGWGGRWFLEVDPDLPKARVYRID